MADPISVTSGIIALVSFGIQASQALYSTIESLKNYTKTIRELKQQLEALRKVLQDLEKVADDDLVSEFESIKLPLYSCATSCQEFDAVIRKCTENSTDSHRSFRDWAKLRYMGDDINGFNNQLAGYKSTIQIALGGMNLRTSAVTMSCLQEYREMIRDTKADLEEHLCQIDERLQIMTPDNSRVDNADERRRMQVEKNSTLKCLDICAQVSVYIDRHQATAIRNVTTPSDAYQDFTVTDSTESGTSDRVTATALNECQEKMKSTTDELQKRLSFLYGCLSSASIIDPSTIEEEKASIQQCLDICDRAAQEAAKPRTNVFEDFSVDDDSRQAVVSTVGDLISAKGMKAGSRSMQLAGQMSDNSLLQIFYAGGPHVTKASTTEAANGANSQFEHRFGTGRNLGSPTKAGSASCE